MDTKPKYLAIFSKGWDASSPLAYTLQRIAKYAHFGYTKNINYLRYPPYSIESIERIEQIYLKILNNTWENCDYNLGHNMNYSEDLLPLKDFSLSHFKKLLELPRTNEKYVEFYLALYHHVSSKGYKAVSYFPSLEKTFDYNPQFYTELKNSFDIKSIVLFRDPVRRAISYCLKYNNKVLPNMDQFFFDYIEYLDLAKSIFSNPFLLIMEELWEGNQKQQLSEYLNHPIDNLWPNLYSPDIGHHLTWDLENYYCPVPCQTIGQSSFIITPQYYNELRNKYSYVYDNWIERFGSLPLDWGKPIDYDKNLENYPYYNIKYKYPLGFF